MEHRSESDNTNSSSSSSSPVNYGTLEEDDCYHTVANISSSTYTNPHQTLYGQPVASRLTSYGQPGATRLTSYGGQLLDHHPIYPTSTIPSDYTWPTNCSRLQSTEEYCPSGPVLSLREHFDTASLRSIGYGGGGCGRAPSLTTASGVSCDSGICLDHEVFASYKSMTSSLGLTDDVADAATSGISNSSSSSFERGTKTYIIANCSGSSCLSDIPEDGCGTWQPDVSTTLAVPLENDLFHQDEDGDT